MILEPLESVNSQLVFFMVDRYLHDSDRYNRICGKYYLWKLSRELRTVQSCEQVPYTYKHDKKLSLGQGFAARIGNSCQQHCSALLHLIQHNIL